MFICNLFLDFPQLCLDVLTMMLIYGNTQTNKECRSDKKTAGDGVLSELSNMLSKCCQQHNDSNASRHPQNTGLFVCGTLSGGRRLRADTFQNIKYIFSQARHCKTIADSYELRAGD